jgi:transcription elongation GreA/GreB family factor
LSAQQTSETWHDNFMFEDSARQINMYSSRLEELIKLKEKIKIVDPPKNKNKISIGSTIVIKDENEKIKTFKIGSYMVLKNNDKNTISYKSPIAATLLKAKIGKIVKLKIGDKEKTFEVLEIKN